MTINPIAQQYAEHCERLIARHNARELDIAQALQEINHSCPEGKIHPMLRKVADLAGDIAEDFHSDEQDEADWQQITKIVKAYLAHNWEPTCWMLAAMYGAHVDGRLSQSYSVVAKRQNGVTTIETAHGELRKAAKKCENSINPEQTDEWFLYNLAEALPDKAAGAVLLSAGVQEYLTEPYYS